MIRVIDSMLRNDVACYWPPVLDALGRPIPASDGTTRFGAVREIGVFWMDAADAYTDRLDRQRMSKAKVFVGEDLEVMGVLWRGRAADIPQGYEDLPLSIPRSSQIQAFSKVPTIKGDQFVRFATL